MSSSTPPPPTQPPTEMAKKTTTTKEEPSNVNDNHKEEVDTVNNNNSNNNKSGDKNIHKQTQRANNPPSCYYYYGPELFHLHANQIFGTSGAPIEYLPHPAAASRRILLHGGGTTPTEVGGVPPPPSSTTPSGAAAAPMIVLADAALHQCTPSRQFGSCRSTRSPHWHGVTDAVVHATTMTFQSTSTDERAAGGGGSIDAGSAATTAETSTTTDTVPMAASNTTTLLFPSKDIQRRFEVWNSTKSDFQKVVESKWKTGDKIVVSASNSADEAAFLVSRHPSVEAIGATKGLLFCSILLPARNSPEKNNASGTPSTAPLLTTINEVWDIVLVPLEANEGRLLASLRMLPLVCGRSDVTLAIVNAYNGKAPKSLGTLPPKKNNASGSSSSTPTATAISSRHKLIFQEMETLNIKYGTFKSGWNAANMGSFWSKGCAFQKHYNELCYSFSKFGYVYGMDEVWLLTHNPIAVVSPFVYLSERRALCWKASTVVKNVHWIILKKQQKSEKKKGPSVAYVRKTAETTLETLFAMEDELLSSL